MAGFSDLLAGLGGFGAGAASGMADVAAEERKRRADEEQQARLFGQQNAIETLRSNAHLQAVREQMAGHINALREAERLGRVKTSELKRNVKGGRLNFTTSYAEAMKGVEYVFIAVGTPSGVDGNADLQYVQSAATSIAQNMTMPLIIINKSTVPIGTGDWVADIVKNAQTKPVEFAVVSCPEFLREGSAIADFMSPHRNVIGSLDRDAANKVAQLHLPLRAPIVITDLRTAEMIKYASNAFLATKISFINELADLFELVGADVKEVAAGMGYDARIGRHFLDAGLGWGGRVSRRMCRRWLIWQTRRV